MLAIGKTNEKQSREISLQTKDAEASQRNELRQQMYERIAQGNALSESEDKAFRQWQKR